MLGIWDFATRRWKSLLICSLIGAIAGFAISSSTSSTYSYSGLVSIARLTQIGGIKTQYVHTAEDIRAVLLFRDGIQNEDRTFSIRKLKVLSQNLVSIETFGPSPDEARAEFDSVLGFLGTLSNELITNVNDGYQKDLTEINRAIASVDRSPKNNGDLLISFSELRSKYRFYLDSQMARPTQVVDRSGLQEKPISPKLFLYLLAGALCGLMIGISLGLLKEA